MPHLPYKLIQITSPFLIYHPYCFTFLVNPSRILFDKPILSEARFWRSVLVAYMNSYIQILILICIHIYVRDKHLDLRNCFLSRMNLVLLWLAICKCFYTISYVWMRIYEFVYIYLYVKNYMNSIFGIVYIIRWWIG